jgi:hypothetical protein
MNPSMNPSIFVRLIDALRLILASRADHGIRRDIGSGDGGRGMEGSHR